MVKKIKFPLEMANEVKVRTLDELRDNFDLNKTVGYFLDGKLVGWLEDRYYKNECEQLSKLDKNDSQLYQKVCEILGVEHQVKEEVDLEKIKLRNQKIAKLKQYTDDKTILNNVDLVAFNQEDLANLIDQGERVIYLCENRFTIPLKIFNKKYIGVGVVEVVICSREKFDFDLLGIEFYNVKFNTEYVKLLQDTPEKLYEIAEKAYKEKNYTEALKYYKEAADLGHANAMYSIGYIYDTGYNHGIERDAGMAMDWYTKAVDLGNSSAMVELGDLYRYGIESKGIKPNCEIAIEWYEKAIALGNVYAMRRLGDIYNDDWGCRNQELAAEWYEKAANKGDIHAMVSIGRFYYTGILSARRSKPIAKMWYEKAAALGNEEAKKLLEDFGWYPELGR